MKKALLVFASLLCSVILWAQPQEPVQWSFDMNALGGDEYELIFTASIDEGWTVYSQYLEEGGPVPTTITYETEGVIDPQGKATEEGHRKEGMDPLFEMNVVKYLDDQDFVITQKVKVIDPTQVLKGYLTFMCCDDEQCLPPTDVDFSFDFESGKSGVQDHIVPAEAPNSIMPTPENNDPVAWTVAVEPSKKKDSADYTIVYTASIAEGWTVYSQYLEEGGPVPTMITYETPDVVRNVGQAEEIGHQKSGLDPIFDMQVVKYLADEDFVIRQDVKVLDKTKPLTGYLTYMTCDDERCLPPTDVDFSIDFSTSPPSMIAGGVAGIVGTEATEVNVDRDGNVIDQRREAIQSSYASPASSCGDVNNKGDSKWFMFFFGFLGGLVAILTPCVFPMIPLTVSFFTKDTKRKGWVNAMIYSLSIIVIYVTIGLLITILFGEEALNRLSTNWIANSIFFVVFILFALSFFGFFEIRLPSSWSTKSDTMADKGGLIGIFFMAFTLAIVSFSCTGPLIGTAIVQAASNKVGPFIVMLGFAIALALPFGLFAAFPAWLNSLPRSGSWMTKIKVVLGFVELALAFKFLSVADMTNHWGFLRYEVFMAIWVLIALGMALWGFGFIKFPHDAPIKKLSPRRWVFSIASTVLAVYLMTGFMYKKEINSYNTLPMLSGIAPPANYNFFLPDAQLNEAIKDKYPSFGKCANNIDCFKDYYEGLAYAKEVGKPILLDHTGHGCVNCRKTEEHIWVDEDVRQRLQEEFVLISLYVDDDKKLDEVLISKTRGTKMRNIGNLWADFQIVNFQQNSQPLYVIMSPKEEVLSNPRGFKEGIEGYLDYLDCGLNTFKDNG